MRFFGGIYRAKISLTSEAWPFSLSLANASERGKVRFPFLAFAIFSGGGELKLTSLGEDKEMKHNKGMEDG